MSDTKGLFACPCCDYLTLTERGQYEICEVCFWEDDGTQSLDGYSAPNRLFLVMGQENFIKLGACDERAVSKVKNDAKSHYKKQNYNTLNRNAEQVHYKPFADFFKGK